MKQHFMMFAAYNQWANGRIYDAAAECVSNGQKFPALIESLIVSSAFRQRQDVLN